MGSPRSHRGQVKGFVPRHGAGEQGVKAAAWGQERLHTPSLAFQLLKVRSCLLEGGGGETGAHSPLGSEQRANKTSDQNSSG